MTDTDWADLTGFQRDLLREVAAHEAPNGLTLEDALSDDYPDLAHARVCQNLDSLVDADCITKHRVDGRSNAYYLTTTGETALQNAVDRLTAALEATTDQPPTTAPPTTGGEIS